jgi:GNAT superfamily N-acetyltransferase
MSTTTLVVRPATPADYPALQVLFAQTDALHAAAEPGFFRVPEGVPRAEAFLDGLLAADDHVHASVARVVWCQGRPVPDLEILEPGRRLLPIDLVEEGRRRRKGVGRALMQAAHDLGKEKGAGEAELNVWEFNREAILFYEALGYRPISRKMVRELG